MRIVFLPLDERPCNLDFPRMIASSGDIELVLPDVHILGRKKSPASRKDVKDFLLSHATGCDAMVVSMDLLAYGGLIASRLHSLSFEDIYESCEVVRRVKRLNPSLPIYASMSVMRCPAYDSSDEEPDYYEQYGRALWRRAWLNDKAFRVGLSVEDKSEVEKISIPQAIIQDYERRREINLSMNIACLDLVNDGTVDFLIFPQDDSSVYGYTAVAQRSIAQAVRTSASRRGYRVKDYPVMSYPGSDEVGCTLLSRAVCRYKDEVPIVQAHYSSQVGAQEVPLYEDRPMCDTFRDHVRACGSRLACDGENADIDMVINAPLTTMREAQSLWSGDISREPDESVTAAVNEVVRCVNQGRRVGLCDVAFANGGDSRAITMLDTQHVWSGLSGYAGWNTHANSLGTVLAQCVIGSSDSLPRRTNVAYRVIEDALYQSVVRWDVTQQLAKHGGDYMNIAACLQWVQEQVKSMLQKKYDDLYLSQEIPVIIDTVDFPWARMFEIGMTICSQE